MIGEAEGARGVRGIPQFGEEGTYMESRRVACANEKHYLTLFDSRDHDACEYDSSRRTMFALRHEIFFFVARKERIVMACAINELPPPPSSQS